MVREEAVQAQLEQTRRAKAEVRDAMTALEKISLDIQEQQARRAADGAAGRATQTN